MKDTDYYFDLIPLEADLESAGIEAKIEVDYPLGYLGIIFHNQEDLNLYKLIGHYANCSGISLDVEKI